MKEIEFKRLLRSGRQAYIKAVKIEEKIFAELDKDMELRKINLDEIVTNAPNADNMLEAIYCYLHYGEYDIDSLLNDLFMNVNDMFI